MASPTAVVAPDCTPAEQGLLSSKELKASMLLAEGLTLDEDIAKQVGVSRRTLNYWKKRPAIQAKVVELCQALDREIVYLAIARKHRRMRVLDDLKARHLRLIEARATDPELTKHPGGDTGLLVKQLKVIGHGEDSQMVEEYVRDSGLVRDIIALDEQARKETGEAKQSLEVTGKDGGPIQLAAVDLRQQMEAEVERMRLRLIEGGKS